MVVGDVNNSDTATATNATEAVDDGVFDALRTEGLEAAEEGQKQQQQHHAGPSSPYTKSGSTTNTTSGGSGVGGSDTLGNYIHNRSSSISESVELSVNGWNAPPGFNIIEWPFRVRDPKTGKALPEVTGWAMDSAGRGPLNVVGGYVGNAIIRIAEQSASDDGRVMGLKPSSLLTTTTSIVGVVGAMLMPVLGAVVDHTQYRKEVGFISGFLAVILVGMQISINEDNWLFILILDAMQTFTLSVHVTAVFAYLPDLTTDQDVIPHYTSRFNIRQFATQFTYSVLIIVIGKLLPKANNKVEGAIRTARFTASIALSYGAIFVGYAWIFLFRKRPALSKVPEGSNLITTGFVQVYRTANKIWKDYHSLKWFMISLLWSPEAGAGVILSMAITFLTTVIEFEGQDLAMNSLCLMTGNILGSFFSKQLCIFMTPLNVYRSGLTFLSISLAISVIVMDGPDRRSAVFGLASTWGFAMGWIYPAQRVLFCTLIPKGQETEMMGLFTFVGQILGWLPTLIYTLMNESGVDQRWCLGVVPFFCMAAVICTLPMGSYDDAIEKVAQESSEKLKVVLAATGGTTNTNNNNNNMNTKTTSRSTDIMMATKETSSELVDVVPGTTTNNNAANDDAVANNMEGEEQAVA